jgi:arginase
MIPRLVHMSGMPLDLGQGRRGVDTGPSAVRIAGILISLDIVEINPILDAQNTTALLGTGLALSALGLKIM